MEKSKLEEVKHQTFMQFKLKNVLDSVKEQLELFCRVRITVHCNALVFARRRKSPIDL